MYTASIHDIKLTENSFHEADALEPHVIATLRTRLAPQIKHFLFPDFLLDHKAPWPLVIPERTWLPDVTKPRMNHFTVVMTAIQMVFSLIDVNHPDFTSPTGGGLVTAWREACKQYHRNEIYKGFANNIWMGLTFDGCQDVTQRGELKCRGLMQLRRQLGLPANVDFEVLFEADGETWMTEDNVVFEVCKEINEHTSQQEKDRIEHDILARVGKKERAAEKYFKKILLEACNRCPVTSCKICPRGLENMLEHVAQYHPRTFWYGDINLLG